MRYPWPFSFLSCNDCCEAWRCARIYSIAVLITLTSTNAGITGEFYFLNPSFFRICAFDSLDASDIKNDCALSARDNQPRRRSWTQSTSCCDPPADDDV